MKITSVAATAFREERGRSRASCLVELQTDQGLVGIAVGPHSVGARLEQTVHELLLGEDPRGVTGLWRRMIGARSKVGDTVLAAEVIAALDIALWDLKAKANDEPLWKTLGGSRPRVNVHAGGCDRAASDDAVCEWFLTMARGFGFRGGLLEVGTDAVADLRRLEMMQRALSERSAEPALMIDAGGRWSPKEAVRRMREIESRFDLTWVEQPAARRDFLGLKRVSDGVRSAVCAGEGIESLLPHLHHHALDIVQVGTATRGITGALQLADAAFGFELPVALSDSPGNIHAHLGSVMPYCVSMEVVDPEPAAGVLSSDVRIEDGWAIAGDRAGHGLTIDRHALAKAAT